MSKVTNLSKATDLVKAAVDARTPKSDIIAQLMVELNISKANAFVYFTKATKATGITITKGEGKAKSKAKTDDEKADEFFEKAAARMKAKEDKAKNKITELSPAKKAVKVREIDAVVAAMQPQSPFAQLGV